MHYYQHHIGDFIRATSRLNDAQTMAYLRLLWMYYESEKPLKPDTKILAFQIGTDIETAQLLLDAFFILCADGWHHTRCDQEIQEYRSFRYKKSKAGKASAEQRKNSRLTDDEQVLNECSTDVQLTNNHKPITNNQEPIKRVEKQRGTRLPANWEPSDEDIAYCKKERTDLQWQRVAENFRDYWLAQAGSKAVKMDWSRVWKTWVRNEKGARTYESAKDRSRREIIEGLTGKKSHDTTIIDI